MSNMKNIPEKIYLQIGDECPEDADFNELSEVSWCKDKIYDNDIEFTLQNKVSAISADKFYKLFKDELLLKCDRLLRDKGMSGAESNECNFCISKAMDAVENQFKEYASIVNERKDNIPADFKQVTGHNSPKEMIAYEKGREDEQEVIMKWIEQWDGSSNSAMGTLLKKKFDEKKDNVGSWVSVEDRLPDVKKDGNKVLLFREMNESQKALSIGVHDTSMIKYCEKSSYWMPLPAPPVPKIK